MKQIKVKYINDTIERIKKFTTGDWIDLRCYDAEIIKTNYNIIPQNTDEWGDIELYELQRSTYKNPVQWKKGYLKDKPNEIVEFFK